MKEKTCCFTGHRDIIENECTVRADLKTEVIKLIERGVIYFLSGGARGFDTIAAECILELKENYPHIKLVLIIPCANHNKGWNVVDKRRYNNVEEMSDKVEILSQHYYRGCMHTRNRYMVDNSSYCLCYLRKVSGGTAYTEKYAQQKKLRVIHI